MKRNVHYDIFIGLFMVLISIGMYILTFDMPKGAARFPQAILVLFAFFGLLVIYSGIKKNASLNNTQADNAKQNEKSLILSELKLPMITLFIIIIYVMVMNLFGFFISTAVFIMGFMYYFRIRSWRVIILNALGVNIFIYLLFVLQLKVPLPKGILFF